MLLAFAVRLEASNPCTLPTGRAGFTIDDLYGWSPDTVSWTCAAIVPPRVDFQGTSTDARATFIWNFGDDSGLIEGRSVSHLFPDYATYTVHLTVIDLQGSSVATLPVKIVCGEGNPVRIQIHVVSGAESLHTSPFGIPLGPYVALPGEPVTFSGWFGG
ncbi:MAG TPA: PKD domain-containing protein, partial [Thermoanaerobaculia bacterium]|nr:PKD domain-containing protein [Thermoanaerobaculia bacterium]